MSEKSQRLLKIYNLLKRRPVTIEYLKTWAENHHIQISERTFYRDLSVLENSMLADDEQIVVSRGEKNKKTWKIEFKGDDKLTEFDINSYLLFSNFLPKPIVESRTESLLRMKELFYKTYSKSRFEDFADYAGKQLESTRFAEFHGDEGYPKLLEDLLWSIRTNREIELLKVDFDITSISKSVAFPMKFLPIKLVYHRGVVHLGGYEKKSKKLILLALSQITKYKLTNIPFKCLPLLKKFDEEMLNRFGITENMDDEVYDIELEFSEMLGCFVKNDYWHPTQNFVQKENGNFIMTLRCGISRELVGWIFMWITNVRVLNPPILKQIVLDKYREVITDYETEKPLVSNNSFRAE